MRGTRLLSYSVMGSLIGAVAACTTFRPVPTPTPPLPTTTPCPYTFNPGPAPPEVKERAQEAFMAAKLLGTLNVQGYGEYSCDHFGVESVYFEFTFFVVDLQDEAALRTLAATAEKIARESLQGWTLGQVKILFEAGKECWWDELQDSCGPIRPLSH